MSFKILNVFLIQTSLLYTFLVLQAKPFFYTMNEIGLDGYLIKIVSPTCNQHQSLYILNTQTHDIC